MPLVTKSASPSLQKPNTALSDFNSQEFFVKMLMGQMATAMPVKVVAVAITGEVAPVGFVDIQPLVNMLDGAGNAIPHGVIYHCPYLRLQGGSNAVVIDPQPGDLGIAIFADHDISSVAANKGQANAGSFRRFDPADGMYLGGILNGTPAQYLLFGAGGIKVVSPLSVTLQAPSIVLSGEAQVSGTAPTINISASEGVALNGPSIDVGPMAFDNSTATPTWGYDNGGTVQPIATFGHGGAPMTLQDGVRGTTQANGDSTDALATDAFVSAAVASATSALTLALASKSDVSVAATGTPTARAMPDRFAQTVRPEDFGASGSALTTTGTIAAGSSTLTLASAIDFVTGHGICVLGAGPACTVGQPTGLTVTPIGATGATAYSYTVVPYDSSGAYPAAITAVNITNGNASVLNRYGQSELVNGNTISWTAPAGTAPTGYLIYGRQAGSMGLVGSSTGATFTDFGDLGYAAPPWCSSSPPASGTAGALNTTITAGGGTTTLTLSTPAVGTATSRVVLHNDTTAVQAAVNSNGYVTLVPNATYPVTNITMAAKRGWQFFAFRAGISCPDGNARFLGLPGGDPAYMFATRNWLNNSPYSDYPNRFVNVTFDAQFFYSSAMVSMAEVSLRECYVYGSRSHGIWVTSATRNGTAILNSLVNCKLFLCEAACNGGDGVHFDAGVTDYQIDGGFYHDNGGEGLYYSNSIGSITTNTHNYTNGKGAAYFGSYGAGTIVANNQFEDPVTVDKMDGGSAEMGPSNTFRSRLTVNFKDFGNDCFESRGNTFWSGAYALVNGFGATYRFLSRDRFLGGPSVVFGPGSQSNPGSFFADSVYAVGAGSVLGGVGVLEGLQFPAAIGASNAPNNVQMIKRLSSTGTTTSVTFTLYVSNIEASGFTAVGTLEVFSDNSSASTVECFHCDLKALYIRLASSTTSAKSAQILNPYSTSVGVSAAISLTDVPNAGGNNTVTLVVTVTHPQASTSYSSALHIHLNLVERNVNYLNAT